MKYYIATASLVCGALLSGNVRAQSAEDMARQMQQGVENDAQQIQNSARGIGDTSQDADPSVQKFDKDGNPNYDADGNYVGCHGLGCKVDNPDKAPNQDNSSSHYSSSSSSSWIGFGRGGGAWSVDSVLGKWTMGEKNGSSSCTLTLESDESFGLRRAWTGAGCPSGFGMVMRWRAAGRDLQLTDLGGKVIGSFRQAGPGRFDGMRAEDNAPMFMSR